jgi:predicted kinase
MVGPRAYLLCGPSLAGKTTIAGQIAEALPVVVISSDEINAGRGLPFGGEGLPESAWAETLRIQVRRFHELVNAGRSVAIDDTLCYRWLRDRWRAEAAIAGVTTVLLQVAPSKEEILARHADLTFAKQRPVLSRERLLEHLSTFEWPAPEENAVPVDTQAQLQDSLRQESAAGHNTA